MIHASCHTILNRNELTIQSRNLESKQEGFETQLTEGVVYTIIKTKTLTYYNRNDI